MTKQPLPYQLLIYLLTELSPSREAANCKATHEIPSILRNPEVYHRIHKSPPMVHILCQIDPILSLYFNIVHPLTS
jgi:hypothetical protein